MRVVVLLTLLLLLAFLAIAVYQERVPQVMAALRGRTA